MIFTTPQFVVFFVLFFAVYLSAPARARKVLLLLGSYGFYGSWNAKFLLLIVGSTLLDFYVGRALADALDATRRKRLVTLSVVLNLGALGFFKYFDFFVESAVSGLASLGVEASAPVLHVLLPVGISFYTFQTMSYTIDVYRRTLEPTDSLLDFALYVSFFPQLVAGPIERASHLLPQIARVHEGLPAKANGLLLIALGCFKKVVIADNVAALVEATYTDPSAVHAPALWLGTYAFAIQIYCDFSGYSDIAVGLGRLLGLDIMQNFASPYAAAGPAEFWRRWHISLSSWLRDYLYIPLGGNRGGWWRVRRNLLLTMLLGGLWHGAAWNFVLWGAWQGLLLVLFRPDWLRRLGERIEARPVRRVISQVVRRLVFFHLVCIGWALFRAASLSDCRIIVGKLLSPAALDLGAWLPEVRASGEGPWLCLIGASMAALLLVQNLWPHDTGRLADRLGRAPFALRFACVAVLLYACMVFAPERPPPFLYFQF